MMSGGQGKQAGSGGVAGVTAAKDEVGRASDASNLGLWLADRTVINVHTHIHSAWPPAHNHCTQVCSQ